MAGEDGKLGDLKRRLLFVLGALVIFRIGSHIPIPGINQAELRAFFTQGSGGILDLLNVFSGGSLSRLSVMTLGIFPYITAAIIMNLAAYSVPALEELKKEGSAGRRKITQYTRYGTVFLALFQGYVVSIGLEGAADGRLVLAPGPLFRTTTVIALLGGTVFLMWLGEQITERGVGNGISLIIFASIVSGLPRAIGQTLELVRLGTFNPLFALFIFAGALAVLALVVFVERGQRRVPLNHAKRQIGNRMYGGQRSHLPLKLNMAGVMPAIFAYAIILFPAQMASFAEAGGAGWLRDISALLAQGQPMYLLALTAAIIFFCFFYVGLVYNPRETADALRKNGAFIPGIRPGAQTADYLEKIVTRLTFSGALYIAAVCLLPEFLIARFGVPFYFGGTSLLIIVVVALDFMEQVQHYLMTRQYGSLLRKMPGGGVS
jgi:preprotein translocase subunit SecY